MCVLNTCRWGIIADLEAQVLLFLRDLVHGQLEESHPHSGQRGAEEVEDEPRFLGFVLPHRGGPDLDREIAAMEHDVDYVGELEVLLGRPPLDLLDQCLHLFWVPPRDALLLLGPERLRGLGRIGWYFGPAGGARVGDVKPLMLPFFDYFYEGALEPVNLLVLANHGPSALR